MKQKKLFEELFEDAFVNGVVTVVFGCLNEFSAEDVLSFGNKLKEVGGISSACGEAIIRIGRLKKYTEKINLIESENDLQIPNLYDWGNDFRNGLNKLNLSTRTRNILKRATGVKTTVESYNLETKEWETREIPPRVNIVFVVNNNLLSFDEWIVAVRNGIVPEIYLTSMIRMFGKKSCRELIEAINEYTLS